MVVVVVVVMVMMMRTRRTTRRMTRMMMRINGFKATFAEKMKTADVADRLARLKPVGHVSRSIFLSGNTDRALRPRLDREQQPSSTSLAPTPSPSLVTITVPVPAPVFLCSSDWVGQDLSNCGVSLCAGGGGWQALESRVYLQVARAVFKDDRPMLALHMINGMYQGEMIDAKEWELFTGKLAATVAEVRPDDGL
jgi:hypothetical protein